MEKKMDYLREFIKNPKRTGSVMESSQELAELITKNIPSDPSSCIVELGSGQGVFTEKILQKMNKEATFFVLEINPFFAKETATRCPDATIYTDSGVNLKHYLSQHNITHCDTIISGLPWASFKKNLQKELLTEIRGSMKKEGEFYAFAYLHGMLLPSAAHFRKLLDTHFSNVKKSKVIWKNIPPTFVYKCRA
ncbi:MAG: SAM-dependent methyltransferase [Nanoarchaeota archaeon]|nr:SAM-dependent methyltransferase [Nanoarchaeota archaeon]